jgi:hypothetical protein
MDCLVGVIHLLVFTVCGSEEMMECLPYEKYCLYIYIYICVCVCVCVCVCFVHLLVWIIKFTEKLSDTLHISLQYYISLMMATMRS